MNLSELLADDLGVTPEDIQAHIAHYFGAQHDLTRAEYIDIVRADFDPWGIRSWPDAFFGSSEPKDPNVCRCRALGGLEHAPGAECPMPDLPPNLPGV